MAITLLIVSAVMFLCVLFNKVSSKLGIPMLLAFIVLGMFFGSDGVVKIPFDDYKVAEQVCSVALIFIMFYGGFGTKWSTAKPIAGKSVLLSTVGVILTALLTGVFCHFALRMELLESFLVGAVISSTDAASVFSILRSHKLNLKYNTSPMLEMESGSNDPCSYMLTIIILTIMQGASNGWQTAYMIFAQIVYGVLFGGLIAVIAVFILKKWKTTTAGFDAVFVLAIALIAYAAPAALGGNGYLSAYIVGIVLGNQPIRNKKSLVHFFDGITGLMQMLIFFLLGLLAFPSQLPKIILPALAIALFLTFVARPIAVFALLSPFHCPLNQKILVSVAGLRGAASIVFAIIAVVSPATISYDIFHIVFFIVLFSILLQGSFLPLISRKLHMNDTSNDVMKTFNDYTDEVPIRFIQFTIPKGHKWHNKQLKDILLPPGTILVLIIRDEQKIVPKGSTVLQAEDMLVLSAKKAKRVEGINLSEVKIEKDNEAIGKPLSEVTKAYPDGLIIMIQHEGRIIIPKGDTIIRENDLLVINSK